MQKDPYDQSPVKRLFSLANRRHNSPSRAPPHGEKPVQRMASHFTVFKFVTEMCTIRAINLPNSEEIS